jgi:ankyrin repeat protein
MTIMKTKLVLLLSLGALASGAQTNFDVLVCKNASYTNAVIIRTNLVYVVVSYANGIAKVALTNLPPALEKQFSYDQTKDQIKVTPLMAKAKSNQASEARDIIASGADVNQHGEGGATALHWAASYGSDEVARFLIEKGADVNSKDDGGLTPLHYASQEGQTNMVEMLLAKGANTMLANDDGMTALHLAATKDNEDLIGLLLKAKADVNAKDNTGATPLHLAAAYGQMAIVKLLLKSGADMTITDLDGKTACDLAQANQHAELAEELTK